MLDTACRARSPLMRASFSRSSLAMSVLWISVFVSSKFSGSMRIYPKPAFVPHGPQPLCRRLGSALRLAEQAESLFPDFLPRFATSHSGHLCEHSGNGTLFEGKC